MVSFSDSDCDSLMLVDVFGEGHYVNLAEFVDFFSVFVDYIPFISPFQDGIDEVKAGPVEVEGFFDVGNVTHAVWFWYVDV